MNIRRIVSAIVFGVALSVTGLHAQDVLSECFANYDLESLEQLRVSRRDSILNLITGAQISDRIISITKYGAKGDGKTDCRAAFDKAMAYAEKKGGARIVVPEGTYFVNGPIHFVSNVCLDITENAVIKFSVEPASYLPEVQTSPKGTGYSPFIYGKGLHDVAIIGKGTIDCSADTWSQEVPGSNKVFRPHVVMFYECTGITMEDFFTTNAPTWCIHPYLSENVICRGLRFNTRLVNNDGIDPEYSKNVLIENVNFDNGDDNIAIKSGRGQVAWDMGIPSESIIIRNCRFKGLAGLVLGSEMSGGVQNVFVENCSLAGYCKRAIYVKTNPDRGGFIRNIFITDCDFEEVEDLFRITSMYSGQGQKNNHFTTIENIYVNGLHCKKARQGGILLQGTAAKPIRNAIFRNVEIEEVKNGISLDHAIGVRFEDCHLGGNANRTPSSISPKDHIFD